MPSLDFIYDITEKLDEEELDYLVLAIREGRYEDKVDVFFRVKKGAEEVFNTSLDQIKYCGNPEYTFELYRISAYH